MTHPPPRHAKALSRWLLAGLPIMPLPFGTLAATERPAPASIPQESANFADLPVRTNLQAFSVVVSPGGPAGGCISGYTWQPTFGGCRRGRVDTETQTDACPAGYRGTRTRTRSRTAYMLQANAVDVQYGAWSGWTAWNQSSCTVDLPPSGETRPRKPGNSNVAEVRGTTFGANGNVYAIVAIDNATSRLVCQGRGTSFNEQQGDTSDIIYTGPFQTDVASCSIQASGAQATAYGNCNTTTGGDGGFCQPATLTATITSAAGCTVSAETREAGRVVAAKSYDVCQ